MTHRQKFIQGSQQTASLAETAERDIFAEWEEFARYGFNKSHAVDYAVIAVQTAFPQAALSSRIYYRFAFGFEK